MSARPSPGRHTEFRCHVCLVSFNMEQSAFHNIDILKRTQVNFFNALQFEFPRVSDLCPFQGITRYLSPSD